MAALYSAQLDAPVELDSPSPPPPEIALAKGRPDL